MKTDAGTHGTPHSSDPVETANDRLKKSFGSVLWGSMIAAVGIHFAIFSFFPKMYTGDFATAPDDLNLITIPNRIQLPEPPEMIQRPARPVISDQVLDPNVTIIETTFEALPETPPPPRPNTSGAPRSTNPVFTPFDVRPQLINRTETERTLQAEYPPVLRSAGIEGEVVLDFHISDTGEVLDTRLAESSGHSSMDEAAQAVAKTMKFTPARNLDKNVTVWVRLRINFKRGG